MVERYIKDDTEVLKFYFIAFNSPSFHSTFGVFFFFYRVRIKSIKVRGKCNLRGRIITEYATEYANINNDFGGCLPNFDLVVR